MEELQLSTNSNLNFLLQQKSTKMLAQEPDYIVDNMFLQIYNSLKVLPNYKCDSKQTISIHHLDVNDYKDDPFLEPILQLKTFVQSNLDEYIHSMILHGSMASLDYITGWSDIDIICILKTDKVKELGKVRNLFLKLENYLYKIDPQQHHGIQFITDTDLTFYTNTFYPYSLYQDAKIIFGVNVLTFNLRDCNRNTISMFYSICDRVENAWKTGVMKHHGLNGVYLESKYKNMNTMYQLKYFLSILMLLPTIWLNLAGVYCSKKQSFAIAKPFLSDENWQIIDKASKVRFSWSGIPTDNKIPEQVVKILGDNYFEEGFKFIQELKQRYIHYSFKYIADYCNAITKFCEQNSGKSIAMCGSIKNPGLSDLDFLVLDEEVKVDKNVQKFFKPLDQFGGDVLICPNKLYPYIPYIIDLRITPLQGNFSDIIEISEKERELLDMIEIIEWMPERIMRVRHILFNRTYSLDKLHLVTKSLFRSINMVAKISGQTPIKYSGEPSFKYLEDVLSIAEKYWKRFEDFVPIKGEVDGNISICYYYKSDGDEFGLLKRYLSHLVSFDNLISKELGKRVNLRVSKPLNISSSLQKIISTRWELCNQMFIWFKNRRYTKGMMKWGWLLS